MVKLQKLLVCNISTLLLLPGPLCLQVARFLSEEVRPLLEPYKAKMDVKIELEL